MKLTESIAEFITDGEDILKILKVWKERYIRELLDLLRGKDENAVRVCIEEMPWRPVLLACLDKDFTVDFEGIFIQTYEGSNKEWILVNCANNYDHSTVGAETLSLESLMTIRDFLTEALKDYKEYLADLKK